VSPRKFVYYFAQCVWQKILASGIDRSYSSDESFSSKMSHLSALAFFPSDEIPRTFNELKLHLLGEANEGTDWFASNSVHSGTQRHLLWGYHSITSIVSSKFVLCLGVCAEWLSA
jgi:hypothetical protein